MRPVKARASAPSPYEIKVGDVLFEDDWIIVVDKPSGLPSQATLDPQRDHCYASVQRYLHGGYVGLHHRLDAMTSGALLMTKSQDVNAAVAEQFQNHTVRKSYRAICVCAEADPSCLAPGARWCIDAPIGELPGERVQKFSIAGKKRKPAQTEVECLRGAVLRDGWVGEFRCAPRTGRTHQIRVHLSSQGLPILGDALYGVPAPRSIRAVAPGRLCLHAESISFRHPVTHEEMCVRAPLPDEFGAFWTAVAKLLHRPTLP